MNRNNKNIQGTYKKLKELNIHSGYCIDCMAQQINRLQKGNINAYFFCNKAQLPEYLRVYVDKLRCGYEIIVWHKTNVPPTYSNKWLPDKEFILYFHKGKGHTFPANYEDAKTIFSMPTNQVDNKKYNFPSVKPLPIIERLIRNSSKNGEVVFDPFLGTGTTAIAAMNLGRRFIGAELNADTFATAKRRIEEHAQQLFANRLSE